MTTLESPAKLFDPLPLGGLTIPNRIAMAPMTRRLAPENRVPTEAMARYYARRAAGGVGLIITEGTHIDDEHAPDSERVPGIFNEAQIEGWQRVVDAVHAEDAVICCQLWHTGRLAMRPIGPSAIPAKARDGTDRATPKPMTREDIRRVVAGFAHAASCATSAGFDAVEVHGAHGYLLDSFISPEANRRDDEYGGPFENRMRMPLEVVRAVREAVGPALPVLYRFSQWRVDDQSALAYPDPETLGTFVTALRDAGVSMLHASTGNAVDPAFDGSPRTLAGWAREHSGLPAIAVGRVGLGSSMNEGEGAEIADPAKAIGLIESGEADMLAVGRALISNPDWPALIRAGRWQDARPYHRELLTTLD